MKKLILLLMFFQGYSQKGDFSVHVSDRHHGANFSGVAVELSQNEKIIYKAQSDFDGNIIIKDLVFGSYELKLNCCGHQTLIIKELYFSRNDSILEFIYPNPYKESVKFCPKNHSDNLIPIVYGLPGEKLLKASKKGKVILGGCVITDCDPKWFCKKHNVSF